MAEPRAPDWPDKAMFAAILLILAGSLGAAWTLVRSQVTVRQEGLPVFFTEAIPGYELTLSVAVLVLGILCLRRQAAVFAYAGAVLGIASLGMYGLVPALCVLAAAAMVKAHMEGEETRNDGIQLHPRTWPDKAMAASLLMVAVGAIGTLQGILLLVGRFDPILLGDRILAGILGLAFGLAAFAAAREVYHLRRPWAGWVALALGLATLGFYAVGPVLALVGMALLALAHKEDEFRKHAAPGTHGAAAPSASGAAVTGFQARAAPAPAAPAPTDTPATARQPRAAKARAPTAAASRPRRKPEP